MKDKKEKVTLKWFNKRVDVIREKYKNQSEKNRKDFREKLRVLNLTDTKEIMTAYLYNFLDDVDITKEKRKSSRDKLRALTSAKMKEMWAAGVKMKEEAAKMKKIHIFKGECADAVLEGMIFDDLLENFGIDSQEGKINKLVLFVEKAKGEIDED